MVRQIMAFSIDFWFVGNGLVFFYLMNHYCPIKSKAILFYTTSFHFLFTLSYYLQMFMSSDNTSVFEKNATKIQGCQSKTISSVFFPLIEFTSQYSVCKFRHYHRSNI